MAFCAACLSADFGTGGGADVFSCTTNGFFVVQGTPQSRSFRVSPLSSHYSWSIDIGRSARCCGSDSLCPDSHSDPVRAEVCCAGFKSVAPQQGPSSMSWMDGPRSLLNAAKNLLSSDGSAKNENKST